MAVVERERWSVADTAELYELDRWGRGYFSIDDAGRLRVHAADQASHGVDLKELVDRLAIRAVDAPILFRFSEILKHRLREMHQEFQTAINELSYRGNYVCVYPIKVNQQRQVVEQIVEFGRPYGFGLEAGSKPELMAVVALADNDTPIICNGFKDAEFLSIAMMAQKIGSHVMPVIEKYSDLDLILEQAQKYDVRPQIGVRVKLAAPGSGRWRASGGPRSKFGLTVSEALRVLQRLSELGMADCLQLLHFHLGSQIPSIRVIKNALNEAARVYVELYGRGAGLKYLDVGGGLGVDYDGSQTNYESSTNYTLGEYARDVVYHVQTVCDETNVPHPTIISESGRAVAAYHSVLVFNVLDVAQHGEETASSTEEEPAQPLADLMATLRDLTMRNLLESYHDAQQALETVLQLFNNGYLSLDQRCAAENLYWQICRSIVTLLDDVDYVPEELQPIQASLADTYFCNFSLFQSLPDSWAIKQLFPVMPIHRLNEEPKKRGILGDITCDSDGRMDRFIDRRDLKRALPLHELDGEPYYLAAFLVGAYQEILGDLHNLFGDTNAVHVGVSETGEPVLEDIVQGDTVRQVLDYVEFDPRLLVDQLRRAIEAAVSSGRIDDHAAGRFIKFYEQGLDGYTYLESAE
ncbi:MAG: biosynthetic arginine decarboxylase [Planctomycetales bacterium]|nr:biosynthetic arginine decarboxylase [Planctomycetales bacterium]